MRIVSKALPDPVVGAKPWARVGVFRPVRTALETLPFSYDERGARPGAAMNRGISYEPGPYSYAIPVKVVEAERNLPCLFTFVTQHPIPRFRSGCVSGTATKVRAGHWKAPAWELGVI